MMARKSAMPIRSTFSNNSSASRTASASFEALPVVSY